MTAAPHPTPVSAELGEALKQRTLTFYGASDDLFECEDSTGRATEEIGCYDRPAAYRITATSSDDVVSGLIVVGLYAVPHDCGCWAVGISPLDEDVPLPSWPVSVIAEGYSTRLTIAVPDDAVCVPVECSK